MYDVIVVGAGPSGSLTALTCAGLGLDVILVEKETVPRQKTCGGCVSLKALKLIKSKIPDEVIKNYFRGSRFFSPDLHHVDVFSNQVMGITTYRDKYDSFLLKLATDAGSSIIDSKRVVNIETRNNKVECKLKGGRVLEGKILVGADGAHGQIARMTGIREKWRKDEVGYCMESRCHLKSSTKTKSPFNQEILEFYFLNIPLGYAWLFPKKEDVSIGIGGILAYLRKPRELFTDFLSLISKTKKVKISVSKINAHLIPFGGFKRNYFRDRILLVGDAAGFVDPLTGEGIYYAMKSGIIAAQACEKALKSEKFNFSFFDKHYRKTCEKQFEKDLRIALNLTHFLHNHLPLLFKGLRNSRASEYLRDLALGKKTYRDLNKERALILYFKLATYLKRDRQERSISN